MSKICCFTGHRKIKTMSVSEISAKLEKVLIELIEVENFTDFRAGGAVGFDSIAALTVLKLKERYPHIKLHLILPCADQDYRFSPLEKQIYRYTKARADSVQILQKHYTSGIMHVRNRALVDGTDLCIAFLEKLEGGTYYTVNYARKNKVKTINLLKI